VGTANALSSGLSGVGNNIMLSSLLSANPNAAANAAANSAANNPNIYAG
jgi:hypothetical protein